MPGRLPPLPPVPSWKPFFPRKTFVHTGFGTDKTWVGRVTLGDTQLCDAFVRSLKLRENEVVFDVLPGPGSLTRSLLSGGNAEEERKEWFASNLGGKGKLPSKTPLSPFPWTNHIPSAAFKPRHRSFDAPPTHKPRLVVAVEPSSDLLVRGLGMDPEIAERTAGKLNEPDCGPDNCELYTSELEPRLKMVSGSPYFWNVLPTVVQSPEIVADLSAAGSVDLDGVSEDEAVARWRGSPPHITLVAQFPHKNFGEQLIAQWLHSVIGAAEGKPGFIWRWGRARIAMLMQRVAYDRLMAQPGELMYSKVSVIAQALYDITPLPPRHHVPNVNKTGTASTAEYKSASRQSSGRTQDLLAYYTGRDMPRDTTYEDDFYPKAGQGPSQASDRIIERPEVLGLLFEPKIEPVIKLADRETWDHVLRHLFIKQANRLEIAISALGFGSDKLLPKIASTDDEFAGEAVPGDTIVRDITIDQWVRIVDVFSKWQFKPTDMWVRNFMKGTGREGPHASW